MSGNGSPEPILVVDDDEVICGLLRGLLEKEGYGVQIAHSGDRAISMAGEKYYPLIVSDIHMANGDGFALLSSLKRENPHSSVVLMTGFCSLDGAMKAIHEGAFDYLSKPLNPEEVKSVVSRALRHSTALRKKNTDLVEPAGKNGRESDEASLFIGKSPSMVEVYKEMAKAAMSDSNVLILGESGSGKELAARAIFNYSIRRNRPFIAVNCGALVETLLESELFGHVKGSFTGAMASRRGLLEEANGGTVFLDEIGEIGQALQVKLLRVFQEGEFKPVGTNETRKVDVRFIVATHRDIDAYVRDGKFREDLYYRLKVITIRLPPLRDRVQDLPDFIRYFLKKFGGRRPEPVKGISPEAMKLLCQYSWPGNVRELEHALERAVAMTNSSILYPEDLPQEILHFHSGGNKPERTVLGIAPLVDDLSVTSLEEVEKQHICRILESVGFNKTRAAEMLGINRATLYRKAERYGIQLDRAKA